jgi:predicted Zn-dependent protease
VNAVAVPGGRILLFRGLIEHAESAEEVAGVLAHELGHVVHRDPTVEALRAAGSAGILGLLVGDVVGAGIVVAASEAVLNASYRREAEARADDTAIRLLAEAGLPSGPFADFFRRMRARYGEVRGVFRYFASHPALEARAERAEAGDAVAGGDYEPVLGPAEWRALRGICSATPAPGGG